MLGLNGLGAYVYVERKQGEIVIRQDFAGSFGLFLYNQDGRFVISNSFIALSEYLRTRVKLTLNRDYTNHFLIVGLASMSYSQTLINEINILPRNSEVHIDIASRSFRIERLNYQENSVSIATQEGMKILDGWFKRWTRLFRQLHSRTNNISIDLTGGMDSRISFVLMMKSGVDINKICVNSRQGKGYTLEEDYKIASEIARHFGFALNNRANFTGGELNYSLEDILSIAFYARMSVHKQLYYRLVKYEDKRFNISGYNGEVMRSYWHPADKNFVDNWSAGALKFARDVRDDIAGSMRRVMQSMLNNVSKDAGVPVSEYIAPRVFRDTWGRFHFGTMIAADFITNSYSLPPLMDPELQKLKLDAPGCEDKNLLLAVIYARYCPELLEFRFNGTKAISKNTKIFAERLSEKFKLDDRIFDANNDGDFVLTVRDSEVSRLLKANNPPIEPGSPEKYVKQVFDKTALRKLFAMYFDEEIYVHADRYYARTIWHPLAECHAVIGAAKAINDVIISKGTQGGIINEVEELTRSEFASSTDKCMNNFLRARFKLRSIIGKCKHLPGRVIKKALRSLQNVNLTKGR